MNKNEQTQSHKRVQREKEYRERKKNTEKQKEHREIKKSYWPSQRPSPEWIKKCHSHLMSN